MKKKPAGAAAGTEALPGRRGRAAPPPLLPLPLPPGGSWAPRAPSTSVRLCVRERKRESQSARESERERERARVRGGGGAWRSWWYSLWLCVSLSLCVWRRAAAALLSRRVLVCIYANASALDEVLSKLVVEKQGSCSAVSEHACMRACV